MKIEELKKALKGLIREEVKRVVAEEVSKAMGKVLVEMVKEIKSSNNNSTTKTIMEETEEENSYTPPTIIKTKNPKLNSGLSETVKQYTTNKKSGSNISQLLDEARSKIIDGDFDKIGQGEDFGIVNENVSHTIEEPKTNLDFLKQIVGPTIGSMENQPSALDNGVEVPDFLKKVFKKDYRKTMDVINQKANQIRPM